MNNKIIGFGDWPSFDSIFERADIYTHYKCLKNSGEGQHWKKVLEGKVMGTLFLESSTRTRWSFESAMLQLGGSVISCEGKNTTVDIKGESIRDILKTAAMYVDVLIARLPESDVDATFIQSLPCHFINAGNGSDEHPTQAMVDAYTIHRRAGWPMHWKYAIVGDFEKSRSIHSFLDIIGSSPSANGIYCYDVFGIDVSKNKWYKDHISKWDYVSKWSTILKDEKELIDILPEIDVLYLNRTQSERSRRPSASGGGWVIDPGIHFSLTRDHLNIMKKDAMVLNPGPRREEMPPELDNDPRIVYFNQIANGLPLRMALLEWIFD